MSQETIQNAENEEIIPDLMYAHCSHCDQQLGTYEPPVKKHIVTCWKCGTKLVISAANGQLSIRTLSGKKFTRTA